MKRTIVLYISILTLALGFSAGWFFRSPSNNSTLHTSNIDGNSLVKNVNSIGTVNRIVLSGQTATLDSAISHPDASKWHEICTTGFPCLLLPPDFSAAAAGSDYPNQVDINEPSGSDAASFIIFKKIALTGSAESYIVQAAGTVDQKFQHSSDAVSGTLNGNQLKCLDDGQMRYCVITMSNQQEYFIRGDYYWQQADQRLAFDGMVRQLLTTSN